MQEVYMRMLKHVSSDIAGTLSEVMRSYETSNTIRWPSKAGDKREGLPLSSNGLQPGDGLRSLLSFSSGLNYVQPQLLVSIKVYPLVA